MTRSQSKFTPYQLFLIGVFVCVLFTIVVDYMTLPALSAILLTDLDISTEQFGMIVSVYAFSAGISALLATGFADRFDRRKLLLAYYGGFLLGMLLCATAHSFATLIAARVVCGLFGGVVASICFAIISDLFEADQRGRVMGYLQIAFAGGQVIGLPLALYLAAQFKWQLTYWIFFSFGLVVLSFVFFKVKPIDAHLAIRQQNKLLKHALRIVGSRTYWTVFSNNILLVLGDVMFMTFSSAYSTNNLGVSLDDLPLLFGIAGAATLAFGPIIGRLADRYGKFELFIAGAILAMSLAGVYSLLGRVPFWLIALVHTLLFLGINARMITSTALATLVPEAPDRGAFMTLDSSFQQIAGGVAATAAGLLVYQAKDGMIHGYPRLAAVVIGVMLITIGLVYAIHLIVKRKH